MENSTVHVPEAGPLVSHFRCQLIQNNTASAAELCLPPNLCTAADATELPKHFFLLNIRLNGKHDFPAPESISLVPSSGSSALSVADRDTNLVLLEVDVNPEFFASLPSSDPTSGFYADLTIPLPMNKVNAILCRLFDIDVTDPIDYAKNQELVIKDILSDLSIGEADLNDIIASFSKRMPRHARGSRPRKNVIGELHPPTLWGSHYENHVVNTSGDCQCEVTLRRSEITSVTDGDWSAMYSGIVESSSLTKQLPGLQKNVLGRSIRHSKVFSQQLIKRVFWTLPGMSMMTSSPVTTGSDLYEVLPPKREATKRKRENTRQELDACKKRATDLEVENARLKALFQTLTGMGAPELERVMHGGPKANSLKVNKSEIVIQGCNFSPRNLVGVSLQVSSMVEPIITANSHKPFSFNRGFDARLHPDSMLPLKVSQIPALFGEEIRAQLPDFNDLPVSWIPHFSGRSVKAQVVFHREGGGYLDPSHCIRLTYPDALPSSTHMGPSDEDDFDAQTMSEEEVAQEEFIEFSAGTFTGSLGL